MLVLDCEVSVNSLTADIVSDFETIYFIDLTPVKTFSVLTLDVITSFELSFLIALTLNEYLEPRSLHVNVIECLTLSCLIFEICGPLRSCDE